MTRPANKGYPRAVAEAAEDVDLDDRDLEEVLAEVHRRVDGGEVEL